MLIFLSVNVINNRLDMTRSESGSEFSIRHPFPFNITAVNGVFVDMHRSEAVSTGVTRELQVTILFGTPVRCIHCSLLLMLPLFFGRILMSH